MTRSTNGLLAVVAAGWAISACGTAALLPASASDGGAGDAAGSPDAGEVADAGTSGGASPVVLPLGIVVVDAAPLTCPIGAAPGATCRRVTVTCPGIPDLGAIVATAQPSTTATGTLFAHRGGGGTEFYTANLGRFLQAGLRTVQVAWDADWEKTPDRGIKDAACRAATLIRWTWETVHGQSRTSGFCAVGHSGGSGVLAYALTHYGMGEYLDYAALGAGPPFGRMDYGCAPDTYSGPPRTLCPELQNAPVQLPAARINDWENTTTCGTATPDPSELTRWRDDSVVSDGASYRYEHTAVTFWDCATQPNGTTGGAYFYSREISSEKKVTCFTQCQVESLGIAGEAALVQDVIDGCVPRH